jgi:hypothetical protein
LRDAIRRTTSAPPGQITRQGRNSEARLSRFNHHSNAPIKPESQSILSKIVARRLGLFPQFNGAFTFEHVKCPPCRRVQHTGDKFWLLAEF